MALAAGMEEARVVFGYLRAPKDTIENASHAWCCVKIEGEYRFVDCWLAFPSQPQNKYQIEEHWFLTKPPDMIYTHFPCEPHDQCLEPAISLETFFALPYVWPTFFAHRLKMIRYNPDTLIVTDDQMCHLTIRVDPNTICIAMVETEDGQVMRALAQCRFAQTIDGHPEKVYKIKAVLPKNAPHGWLKLFVAPLEWLDTHMFYRPDMPSNDINSMVDNYSGNGGHMSSSTAMTLTLQVPDLAAVFPLTQHVSGHVRSALPEHPFGFVHLHPCQYEFNVQEPQCYYLYPLQTYNFFIRGGESHHKLAIRSPGGKLFKLMYYPQDHLYDGSVTLSEVGKWTLICLTHNSTGWLVVATWMCTHPLSS
ncbi:hypothetical protein DM01DRAFT_1363563 [Hesseltinella vesiculosa]|uniref:CYK3 C-terminal Ig-like domain-containing protein n=1 Tax=Hesseltinella vesiculosa TaxID=101127 RepID=A0A1X2GCP1_9FUNG|nr:hypothetical protein DM01DRAFT_1363563 [Hesseltinella vesiculosa]